MNAIAKHKKKVLAIGDQLTVSGTNFCLGVLITRFIGVEAYGMFALYWMVFLFLQGISNAFIGLPAQVLSGRYENPQHYLERNNRLGVIGLGLVLVLLYVFFSIYALWATSVFGYGYWLFPLVIVLFLKQEINRKYFYALGAQKKVLYIDLTTYFLQLPILFICSFFLPVSLSLVLAVMAATALTGQVVFAIIKPRVDVDKSWKKLPVAENWKYGRFLILTAILQWFSGNVFLVSAAGIVGVGAVGIIRILQNVMGVLHVLFLTLENVVPVKGARLLHQHGRKYLFTYIKKVIRVTGLVYLFLLLLLAFFGADLLQYLYGVQYAAHVSLLHLFIAVYILVFLGTIAQILIKTLQLNYGIFLAYVLSVLTALALAGPLLNALQVEGVIVGLGILQLVTIGVYAFVLKRALS